jgi:hypothetical protein
VDSYWISTNYGGNISGCETNGSLIAKFLECGTKTSQTTYNFNNPERTYYSGYTGDTKYNWSVHGRCQYALQFLITTVGGWEISLHALFRSGPCPLSTCSHCLSRSNGFGFSCLCAKSSPGGTADFVKSSDSRQEGSRGRYTVSIGGCGLLIQKHQVRRTSACVPNTRKITVPTTQTQTAI